MTQWLIPCCRWFPLDETHPAAVPLHAEVLAPALEWARGELEGRILFYSARGEQEVPEVNAAATPKKAPAKRISNAALAEQVSALSAQMKVLMKQQAMAANGPYQGPRGCHRVLPAVSQGLLPAVLV